MIAFQQNVTACNRLLNTVIKYATFAEILCAKIVYNLSWQLKQQKLQVLNNEMLWPVKHGAQIVYNLPWQLKQWKLQVLNNYLTF